MNPLIKKEIRLLLPAWTAAILLAIIPTWIAFVWSRVPSEVNLYAQLAFGLGVLFLSIASFGEEFSFGTFSVLLSQPMERRRIWLIKTSVLGIAFVSVLLAVTVSWDLDLFIRTARVPNVLTEFGFLALSVAVTFSSGLWATLLLRRMLEAFWLTLLAPLAIMVALYGVHAYFHWSNQTDKYVIPTVLLLYSLAGFFWARWLFLHAQDTQWTGGEITFPSRKKASQRATVSYHPRHWLSALVWKELQLHQVNILIAGVVFVLDLASVIIRKFHPHFADPYVRGILELVWLLWLLMPLLIGSAAVAEEHRGGTFESQLCLPVSRRMQFVTKFSVALLLSLLLGGVMPLVIERMLDFNLWIFVVAAAIFFISFYASTVARTTIQAIGLTIIIAVAIYFCAVATAVSVFKLGGAWPYARVGLGLLRLYLGVPIFLLTLAGLMYWNFKWLHAERKLRWRNGLAVLGSFAFTFACTNGIYFRTWEWFVPAKPHGRVRLSESVQIKIAVTGSSISEQLNGPFIGCTAYALLPGGRLWSEMLVSSLGSDHWTSWYRTIEPGPSQFVGGSNWVTVAADKFQALGIESNGTLWSLPTHLYGNESGTNLVRIGSDTNWTQVAGGSRGFLLLKNNHSLWFWGTNSGMVPTIVSENADWRKLFSSGPSYQKTANAVRKDNSVWELSVNWTSNHLQNFSLQRTRVSNFERRFVSLRPPYSAGVTTNGELWFVSYAQASDKFILAGKIQLGRDWTWRAAAFNYSDFGSVIAIRDDGSLWKWRNCWALMHASRPDLTRPVRLGSYSDWIALWPAEGLVLALSADGSLWALGEPSRHVWLAPPRKPVYLGNIFKAHN